MIHQAQIGRSMIFTHELAHESSLKVFGMCWRRLYRVLDSCIDDTRPKPDGNTCSDVMCLVFLHGCLSNEATHSNN